MCVTLIVEDSATFRQSLKETLYLRFPLMRIEEAVDGREALSKLNTFLPDLIFMDIRLPGENGLQVAEKIKARDYPGVIIVLTSHDLPEYRDAAYASGASYFLTKGSVSGNEIMALVESIVSSSGGYASEGKSAGGAAAH